MFSSSVIDPSIIQAYLETDYRIHGETPITLNVDVANPALAELHKAYRVTTSTFITACNPFSQALAPLTNIERQSSLSRELKLRGLPFFEGIGLHPSNSWPGESSFLVLDMSLEAAKALGAQHEQNAIIWNGPDAVPELILLR